MFLIQMETDPNLAAQHRERFLHITSFNLHIWYSSPTPPKHMFPQLIPMDFFIYSNCYHEKL